MTEADFEVLPRGTLKELRMLRRFANEMMELHKKYKLPNEVAQSIETMQESYSWVNETYNP